VNPAVRFLSTSSPGSGSECGVEASTVVARTNFAFRLEWPWKTNIVGHKLTINREKSFSLLGSNIPWSLRHAQE
jgi:hypothetical protein